ADPLAHRARPGVRLLEPRQDLEERRLAGSVGTHQPDPIPFGQAEREALEQRPRAELLGDEFEAQQEGAGGGHGGHGIPEGQKGRKGRKGPKGRERYPGQDLLVLDVLQVLYVPSSPLATRRYASRNGIPSSNTNRYAASAA